MCRLYAFRSNAASRVECDLVHAQNALILQSQKDMSGRGNVSGWGIATYDSTWPHIERQSWAAYHGEHFRRAAAGIRARTVLAHVRRATVGAPTLDNTHPFTWGHYTFIHNGTVHEFARVRGHMLENMLPHHAAAIRGTTDSEHLFHLLMSYLEREGGAAPLAAMRAMLRDLLAWCCDGDAEMQNGLNFVLTNGDRVAGTRWGRTLYHLERDHSHRCELCGELHVEVERADDQKAVIVASEPLTSEAWRELPDRTLWEVTPDFGLHCESW